MNQLESVTEQLAATDEFFLRHAAANERYCLEEAA
jgi:hypothetical protein